tara:strand:- start:2321 stop:2749 length:429 start_codon:yes stop_codon:yes gene_type:complete
MAKSNGKKKSRSRPKYKSAINLRKIGIGYGNLAVTTNGLFNQNPISFVLGQAGDGSYRAFGPSAGTPNISLREIFQFDTYKNPSVEGGLFRQIGRNAMDNLPQMAGGYIGLAIADKVLMKVVAPKFNGLVRSVPGLGDLVKM